MPCFFCSVLLVSPALASGFAVARFGGEQGHPTATNPTAIYYNPAGIGMSHGTHLFADLNLVWRTQSLNRPAAASDTADPPGGEGANTGEASLFNILPAPGIGVTTKLGELALGGAIYVPMGGRARWDTNPDWENHPQYPGPVDGVQRWWVIEGELLETYVTLAAAYDLGNVSLGLSGSLIRNQTNLIRARVGSGTNATASEGRSWLNVCSVSWGFGVGVLYEVSPDSFWIGASYTSKPDPFSDELIESGTLKNNFGGRISEDDVDLHQDLPDIYRLGIRARPSKQLELRLFGDFTRWSQMERQCVSRKDSPCDLNPDGSQGPSGAVLQNQPRNWNDTFGVRAGASLWTNDATEVLAGAGFSSNAVPDETLEPSLPDFDTITLSLGGRFELSDKIFVAASYTQFVFLPRDNRGKSTLAAAQSPSAVPDAGAEYGQHIGALNLNADFEF